MHKLKLHWSYFKSTLVFNLTTSMFLMFILMITWPMQMKQPPFYVLYISSFMFGGPLFDFTYKIINRQDEFYYYYNRAITKYSLLISSMLICIAFGSLLLIVLGYAKLT